MCSTASCRNQAYLRALAVAAECNCIPQRMAENSGWTTIVHGATAQCEQRELLTLLQPLICRRFESDLKYMSNGVWSDTLRLHSDSGVMLFCDQLSNI